MTIRPKTAKVVEALVEYDGPQLLLLKSSRNLPMFGVAVEREGFDSAFFCCEVRKKTSEKYFEGTADLHYVYKNALSNSYYMFDLGTDEEETISLEVLSEKEAENQSYWPSIGFFSRDHTSDYGRGGASNAIKVFKIDGKWTSDDFSSFHNRVSQLHALYAVLDRLDEGNVRSEQAFIRQAIQTRLWRGGGSYVGFYGDLEARNDNLEVERLEVARIKYASPGEIALRGNNKALSDISDVIDLFNANRDKVKTLYRELYVLLKKDKLLSAEPNARFSSERIQQLAMDKSLDLATEIGLEAVGKIRAACSNNPILFSKLVLSICRRALELHEFYAEGRVQKADSS